MEIGDIVRSLNQKREAQVVLRQVAIAKRDMLQLREAQLNIEAIDRAMADEVRLAEGKGEEPSKPFAWR